MKPAAPVTKMVMNNSYSTKSGVRRHTNRSNRVEQNTSKSPKVNTRGTGLGRQLCLDVEDGALGIFQETCNERPAFIDKTMVGDSENYSLGRLKSMPGQEFNSVFALRTLGICNRIMRLDRNSKPLKLTDDVHDLAVAYVGNVLLESEAEN